MLTCRLVHPRFPEPQQTIPGEREERCAVGGNSWCKSRRPGAVQRL